MTDFGHKERQAFLREYQARKELSIDAAEYICAGILALMLIGTFFLGNF